MPARKKVTQFVGAEDRQQGEREQQALRQRFEVSGGGSSYNRDDRTQQRADQRWIVLHLNCERSPGYRRAYCREHQQRGMKQHARHGQFNVARFN